MTVAEIKKMSASDRLEIIDVLWDSFRYENERIRNPG